MIDVGTNSVKLFVADVTGLALTPVFEDSKQTRLGAGFYESHRLQPEPIASTAKATAHFVEQARALGAISIRLVATSAARESVNGNDLIEALRNSSGLEMEILSGEQEADWVFHGVTSDPRLTQQSLLILDVGGGSTEFIVGEKSIQRFRQSYRLGTVRLLEQLALVDPPGLPALHRCEEQVEQFLEDQIAPALKSPMSAWSQTPLLVGTGGSATIFSRMKGQMEDFDRDRIEAVLLTRDWVSSQTQLLWQMPLAERQKVIGLPPKRADVILTGMVIYQEIMKKFGFLSLTTSTRGLRYTAVLNP